MACGRARGAKARERRVWAPYRGRCGLGVARGVCYWACRAVGGCATPLLSVAGVAHAPWNKCAATGVMRVGRVVFTRGELTCCSRARMLCWSLSIGGAPAWGV